MGWRRRLAARAAVLERTEAPSVLEVLSASLHREPDARFEASFADSWKIVSSSVRTCGENGDAPTACVFPLSPLSAALRIRLAPEQRQDLHGAGRRGHGDRACRPER